jgi:phosphatidylglycerol:prolipoprotein diacylglycerol transferase
MLPTISIGPLVVPTAALAYILGAWVALSMIEHSAKILKLDVEATYGMGAAALAIGFVGARLVFVAMHWPAYRNDLIGIIWPLTSGYEVWGGLLFALVTAILYGRAKQLPLAATLDAVVPGLLVGFIVVSVSDLVGGPGYGSETNLPWGIDVFGIHRHPVQIYEITVAMLAMAVWWRALNHRRFEGELFLLSMAVYSGGRLFVDAFRANAWLTSGGYHVLQIIALLFMLLCLFLLGRGMGRSEPTREPV